MAATYDQLSTIALNSGFQNRVQCAMVQEAFAVYANAGSNAAAKSYAVKVMNGQVNLLTPAFAAVTCSSTIANEVNPLATPDFGIADADILNIIGSLWNTLAGA